MTTKELNLLKRIPKTLRKNIVDLKIKKSNDYNNRGQQLNSYTITWNNGDEHTFQNIEMMLYLIKEYTVDGYYLA